MNLSMRANPGYTVPNGDGLPGDGSGVTPPGLAEFLDNQWALLSLHRSELIGMRFFGIV